MKFALISWRHVLLIACSQAATLLQQPISHKANSSKGLHAHEGEIIYTTGFDSRAVDGVSVLNAQYAPCIDNDGHCPAWAAKGECTKNPSYMHANCQLSCGLCSSSKPKSIGARIGVRSRDASWIPASMDFAAMGATVFIPYAIMVLIIAFAREGLDGSHQIQLAGKRDAKGFAFGLFSLDHCLDSHMWICACSFCCVAIQTADNLSKTHAAPRATIPGFWIALIMVLGMQLLLTITLGLAWILVVAVAVYFRQRIRQTYGLPYCTGEVLAWDCLFWCCCPWCTVAQEARQVQLTTGEPVQVMSTRIAANPGNLKNQSSTPCVSGLRVSGVAFSIENVHVGMGGGDPTQEPLRSQVLAKLGLPKEAAVTRLTGFCGGQNQGVWVVQDPSGQRSLVLKLVPSRCHLGMPSEADRFERICRDHPSIENDPTIAFPIKVLKCVGHAGVNFHDLIVMREVAGQPLGEVLAFKRSGGHMYESMQLLRQLGSFLARFHNAYNNKQHGDFQLSNIFYDASSGGFAMIDIADMGNAVESDISHFCQSIRMVFGHEFYIDAKRHFEEGYRYAQLECTPSFRP
mmetsp:Transcript_29846/g.47689  ORF Transcript_29846/g.47689 Transcript_29846/m.47689 type:complete len:573 (+) Transcript_29846:22-1740(+)